MGEQKPLVWYFPKANSIPRRETAALKPQGGIPIGQKPPEQKASSQGVPAPANPGPVTAKGPAPLPSEPADLSPLEMAKMAVQKIQNGERKRLKALQAVNK